MVKSFRTIFTAICFILVAQSSLFAQQIMQNKGFTYVPAVNNQAILIREIPLKDVSVAAQSYNKLKSWIKKNFTTDLINSSIVYYNDDQAVLVKSKVDLLLPLLNEKNISEKSVMNYHLYTFIDNGKCIIQFSNIEYKIENAIPVIKKKVRAENFVTNDALQINDVYKKERQETQKGTLYYFNELASTLEKTLNESPNL